MRFFLLIVCAIVLNADGVSQSTTLLPDLIPYRKGSLWGYCNQYKKLIIPAIYLRVEPFKEGFAVVYIDSVQEGVINRSGIIIHKVQKDTTLFVSDSGRVYIYLNQKILSVREKDGFWFTPKKYFVERRIGSNIYLAKKNDRYGLVDKNENILIPFNYSSIAYMDDEGYFRVKTKSGKSGYINLSSEKLMKFKSKKYELSSFSEGLAGISKKGKPTLSGYINRKGEIAIPLIYEKIYSFQNGLAEVKDKFKTGIVSTKGDTIISFNYGQFIRYTNGNISCDLNFSSLLFNKNGNEILRVKYDYLRYVNDSIIIVAKKGPGQLGSFKYGIIDITGREVWPCTNYAIYGSMAEPLLYVAETFGKSYYMDFRFNKYYED